MRGASHLSIYLLRSAATFCLASCAPIYYPGSISAPVFSKAGELQIAASHHVGGETGEIAVAVTDHLGIIATGHYGEDTTDMGLEHRVGGDLAIGYFDYKDHLGTEAFLGLGLGDGVAYYHPFDPFSPYLKIVRTEGRYV